MTGRERVAAIINGGPVDRCAYWTGSPHGDTWPIYFKHFGISTPEELYTKLGDDIRWVPVGGHALHEGPVVEHCETPDQVDEAFEWPEFDSFDFSPWIEQLKAAEGYYRLSGNLSMFFHWNCFSGFGGIGNYLLKMKTHPEVVHRWTRLACDYYLKLNRLFFEEAAEHFEAYKISHDLGTQLSLMMSPAMLDEFIFPYIKEQADLGHEFGVHVCMHCCGAIKPIIPKFIEMGIELLHPIQALAAGMDAESIAEFKDDITFIGGIDTQELLMNGTPDDVRADVRRVAKILGPLVISPSHEAVLPNVPPENVEAMAEAVQDLEA